MNSFYAVRVDEAGNRIRCEPDEAGFICSGAGDLLRFADPRSPERFVPVNSLVFQAGAMPLKVQLNDNSLYPLYLAAHQRRGVERIRVNSLRVLTDSVFYYEGMTV